VKWDGAYSVAIRPKPKKGGKVSSKTEEIPERVDTGVGGSNNARALPATHTQRWTCVGGKVQQRRCIKSLFRTYIFFRFLEGVGGCKIGAKVIIRKEI